MSDQLPQYTTHPHNAEPTNTPIANHISNVIKRIKLASTHGERILLPNGEIQLDSTHFKPLAPPAPNQRISFIDGGQTTIFTSPTLHIEYIRIFWSTYHDTQRIHRNQTEAYLLITTIEREGELHYKIESIPDHFSFPLVSLHDPTLCTKGHSVPITSVATMCRALCEYSIIGATLSEAQPRDIICRDGDLDSHNPTQERMINELTNIAQHKEVSLIGVSKTTTLLSNTGNSAIASLLSIAPQGAWIYQPPTSRVMFAKFHSRAEHIFRVDYLGKAHHLQHTLALLAMHSTDPAFLGYPYGLLDADMNARIQSDERDYLKTLFWANIGEQHDTMKTLASATDGHSILDRIKYQ